MIFLPPKLVVFFRCYKWNFAARPFNLLLLCCFDEILLWFVAFGFATIYFNANPVLCLYPISLFCQLSRFSLRLFVKASTFICITVSCIVSICSHDINVCCPVTWYVCDHKHTSYLHSRIHGEIVNKLSWAWRCNFGYFYKQKTVSTSIKCIPCSNYRTIYISCVALQTPFSVC